ncbi:uncharacterized protein MYCFIDRAFT_205900 [Pseudocercospora fijiensis CIRAD86]|uniref:Uncharacterized protein n=1 Tax=Pseudocercospora fijiensis (strain CIRAD86) TaxID=383855 RepID=N1Q8F8_PSEFD|nr:uncharacterized protein MYCFIDRAFT_205900 [Pseudocercospora fijiensis CIRAD86]EME88091.1 hypothetical protein MYCFIDRAFT_205900 [Pseudocercospora fijiensis CIRAD86]
MELDSFDVRTDGVGNGSAQELMRPSRRFAVSEREIGGRGQVEVRGGEIGDATLEEVIVDYVLWYGRAVLCQARGPRAVEVRVRVHGSCKKNLKHAHPNTEHQLRLGNATLRTTFALPFYPTVPYRAIDE